MVRVALTMHQSCTDTNTVSKQKEARFLKTHVVQNHFRAYGTFDANRAPILRQDWHYVRKDRNELPLEPRHLVVPSGASKTIYERMVCPAQTMHLSWTDTNTVSKQKRSEIPCDPRHLGVPSGASKMIYEPMVFRRKPCSYLASRLALHPKGPKRAST